MYDLEACREFYQGKRVLVTGHTGFKGSWLCRILLLAGARVTGYSLKPPTDPALFHILGLEAEMDSVEGDIRQLEQLKETFELVQPELVIHLAAQPIVRDSYQKPVYTYETNVMGTVNLLECARLCPSVKSLLNVTTDKVYENREWEYGYRECDPLDGYDPYSNSKSCSELVTHSYQKAFFGDGRCAVSTARAGNVIGGGDLPMTGLSRTVCGPRRRKRRLWCAIPIPPAPFSMCWSPFLPIWKSCRGSMKTPRFRDIITWGRMIATV